MEPQAPKKLVLTIEQMPLGGYLLSDPGGQLKACSSMPEIYNHVGQMAQQKFNEALYFPQPPQATIPLQPTQSVASHQSPMHVPQQPPPIDMPRMFADQAEEVNQMVARTKEQLNGLRLADRVPNVAMLAMGLLSAFHFAVNGWPFGI